MFSCPASAFLLETEIWVHDHIVLTHVCHPILFHAGSSVLCLLEKLLFCLTHVGEKNSQDNFWKKKKGKTEMPHSCSLASLLWSQPWDRAGARLCCCKSSFGGASLTLLPPSEAEPPNLGIWKEGWSNTPWVQLGCRILEAALAPRKTSWRLYSLASGSSWLAMLAPI